MKTALEKEAVRASGLKPKPAEERRRFLSRLAVALANFDDDDFQQLGGDLQTWVNAAITAYNSTPSGEIAEFDAAEPEEDEEEPPVTGRTTSRTAARAPVKKPLPAAVPASMTGLAPVKKTRWSSGPRPEGGLKTAVKKMMLLRGLSSSVEELDGYLRADGIEVKSTTLIIARGEFRHSIAILNAAGTTNLKL